MTYIYSIKIPFKYNQVTLKPNYTVDPQCFYTEPKKKRPILKYMLFNPYFYSMLNILLFYLMYDSTYNVSIPKQV